MQKNKKRMIEALLILFLASVLVTTTTSRSVVEAAESELLDFGDGLVEILDTENPPSGIFFNGRKMKVQVTTNDRSVIDNLDSFENWCDAGGDSVFRPVLREQRDERGYVACIRSRGGDSFWERAKKFAETTDVTEFGKVYYLRAEKGAVSSRVFALSLEDRFPLADLFPAKGDAPGKDPLDLRPNGSRRLASAWVGEGGHVLATYEMKGQFDDLVDDYEKQLTKLGWRFVATEKPFQWIVQKDGHTAFALLAKEEKGATVNVVAI